MRPLFVMIFILIARITPLCAQEPPSKEARREQAYQAIRDLKEGCLIVSLQSQSRKIESLQQAVADPSIKASEKNRVQLLLDKTVQERDTFNTKFAGAFSKVYDFSAVLFIYDTSLVALKNGVRAGIFLNDALLPDPSITTAGQSKLFVLRYESSKDNWEIADIHLNNLNPPFPYSTDGNKSSVFTMGVPPQFITWRINKNLHSFFNSMERKKAKLEYEKKRKELDELLKKNR